MTVQLTGDAKELGKWLVIAQSQRERALKQHRENYGESSAIVNEASLELTRIKQAINECVQAAATAPLTTKSK